MVHLSGLSVQINVPRRHDHSSNMYGSFNVKNKRVGTQYIEAKQRAVII